MSMPTLTLAMFPDDTISRLKVMLDIRVTKTDTGCWTWNRPVYGAGYPYLYVGPKKKRTALRASRVAWELAHGPIPSGHYVCHHCDTPSCVRIDHLFLGTPKDNMADMTRKGRNYHPGRRDRSKCRNGHNYADNVVITKHGYNRCVQCYKSKQERRRVKPDATISDSDCTIRGTA